MIKIICAWCGVVKQEGDDPPSHGICADCAQKIKKESEHGFITTREVLRRPRRRKM